MLDIAQQDSFLMEDTEWSSKSWSAGNTEQLITNCVCTSSPVSMLPIALNEGVITSTLGNLIGEREYYYCSNQIINNTIGFTPNQTTNYKASKYFIKQLKDDKTSII